MYESVIDLVGGNARMLFVKLKYTLATEEAERIGLDHMARITGGSGGTKGEDDDSAVATQSKVADHVIVQHSAIKMLASRVRLILDYVKAVEAGELPHNHEVMREAKALAKFFGTGWNWRFHLGGTTLHTNDSCGLFLAHLELLLSLPHL